MTTYFLIRFYLHRSMEEAYLDRVFVNLNYCITIDSNCSSTYWCKLQNSRFCWVSTSYKNALLTLWKIVLIRCDLQQHQLRILEKNRCNSVDCLEVTPNLALTYNLAQLYIKSNIYLCIRFRDLTLSLILLLVLHEVERILFRNNSDCFDCHHLPNLFLSVY